MFSFTKDDVDSVKIFSFNDCFRATILLRLYVSIEYK